MAKVYVAGPMRGLPEFNFPAFDAASAMLRGQGWTVISPAEMDREHGIDEKTLPQVGVNGGEHEWVRVFIRRDVDVLVNTLKGEDGDAIALLPGCKKSTGCSVEFGLAKWAKLKVISAISGTELDMADPQSFVDAEGLDYVVDKSASPPRWWKLPPEPQYFPQQSYCGCGDSCSFPLPSRAELVQMEAERIANSPQPLPDVADNSPFMRRIRQDQQNIQGV